MKSKSLILLRCIPVLILSAVLVVLFAHAPCEGQPPLAEDSLKKEQNGLESDGGIKSGGSNAPVARVNGVTIYQSDLSCAVEASLARKLSSSRDTREEPGSNSRPVDNKKTLKRLVDLELLYQESLKHRFHGLVEESEEVYQKEVKRLGGEDRLASALQCNNISPEQFRKSIFRNLSIKRLLNKLVYSRVQVTEDEIVKYYESNKDRFRQPESVRISQILIKAPSDSEEGKWQHAENRALTIYRDAATGADFVRLARRHSEDPVSASAGGDMGLIQKGSQHGILDSTIFSLAEGTVTKPIRSHQGFHILKVTSTTPSTIKTLDESRQQIITHIRRMRSREMISSLVDELRSKAQIEIINSSTQDPGPGSR